MTEFWRAGHTPSLQSASGVQLKTLVWIGSQTFPGWHFYFHTLSRLSQFLTIKQFHFSAICNNSCPYSPQSHFSSLLSSGPEGAVDLFIGSPMDLSGQDNGIYRLPLPSSGLTSADNSTSTPNNHIKGGLRTMKNNDKWLNVPEFVGTVEVDDFVYFFFREVAVDFSNCGRVVHSRVARVCKNDLGGEHKSILNGTWTTFLKARLNCSLPGEYPFYYDYIQSVTYLEEERLFYATFTTAEYVTFFVIELCKIIQISYSLRNSIVGSAVCSFTLDSIEKSFAGPYKHQLSDTSIWTRVHYGHSHSQCNSNSSSSVSPATKYQLMFDAVQPIKAPLIRLDLERLSHIAVEVVAIKNDSSIHAVYLASGEGLVYKYSVSLNKNSPSSQAAYLVETLHPFDESKIQLADRKIKTMHFLKPQVFP